MKLSPSLRRLNFTAHLTASLSWIGALAVFFAHAVASVASQDAQLVRAACIAMGITAWFVILPLSIGSVVTGLIQALGTAWGLVRHYWVLAKLLLTALATVVLLLKLAPISTVSSAALASTFSPADFSGLRMSLLIHAFAGMLVLLTIAVLAVYKPAGLTPHGARKAGSGHTEPGEPTVLPRWVRAFAVALGIFVVVVLVMLHGGHGPGMHAS
jgi:hypothetical protein